MYLQAVDPDQVGSWLIWICSVLKKKDKPMLSMKVVNIHQLLCTVDSKIHENCCKQKIYTNSGNGFFILVFHNHLQLYNIHHNLPLSMKNSILLLSCIFESIVSIHMHI